MGSGLPWNLFVGGQLPLGRRDEGARSSGCAAVSWQENEDGVDVQSVYI